MGTYTDTQPTTLRLLLGPVGEVTKGEDVRRVVILLNRLLTKYISKVEDMWDELTEKQQSELALSQEELQQLNDIRHHIRHIVDYKEERKRVTGRIDEED